MKNIQKAPQAFYLKLVILFAFAFLATHSAQAYIFTSDLTVGSTGTPVAALQSWLISHNFDIPAVSTGVSTAGYFGNQTKAALIAYQQSVGLPPFGYFGKLTRGRLNAIANDGGNSTLNVAYPNGGEKWVKGTNQNIVWLSPVATTPTHVDISLIPYQAPCLTRMCPMLVRAPINVAAGIDINQHSYNWTVGTYGQGISYIPESPVPSIPDGKYSIQICVETTNYSNPSTCDTSDATFTISSTVSSNPAPVITGITAPPTLVVNQVGSWTIQASDPANSQLSYVVNWGDMPACTPPAPCATAASASNVQNSTFTHSYSSPKTYTVTYTVTNAAGYQAQASTTVLVLGLATSGDSFVRVTSPNGGEMWFMNSTHPITWINTSTDPNAKVDLYLYHNTVCSPGYVCDQLPPYVLDKNIPTNAIYNWIVGTDINNNYVTPATNYTIKICQAGTSNCDISDGPFTISGPMTSTP